MSCTPKLLDVLNDFYELMKESILQELRTNVLVVKYTQYKIKIKIKLFSFQLEEPVIP